jgi:hypothetical protein
MFVNSVAMSTFDISSVPEMVWPKPAVFGVPIVGAPEFEVTFQLVPPSRSRPASFGKLASDR